MNLSSYKSLLAAPPNGAGMLRLVLAYGLGRLPVGINALALALVTQTVTGSAAAAGLASAAYLVALGVQAPLLGRWIDTHGPQGTIGWALCVHIPALLAFAACAALGKSALWLVACAACAGAAMPPVSPIFRAVLRKTPLNENQRHAAFALDAVMIELCFVVGPMITATLVALKMPWLAIGLSAAIALVGGVGFVRAGAVRMWGQPSVQAERHWSGPLKLKPVRRVLWAMACFGLGVGLLEMALTAAATSFKQAHAVGWAFAALSISSAVAGLWHGAKALAMPHGQQFALALAWLGAGVTALAWAPSVGVLLGLCFVVGIAFAPGFTAIHSAMADATPPEQSTEAFTWLGTVIMVGIGLGWGASGLLAQGLGWRWCMVVAAMLLLVGAGFGLRMQPSEKTSAAKP